MRWGVSIGVVLVAGAMAGGHVVGIAAPNSRQLVDREAARRPSMSNWSSPSTSHIRWIWTNWPFSVKGYAQAIVLGISAGAQHRTEPQGGCDLFRVVSIEAATSVSTPGRR